jgi:hypothetical protein
MQRTLIVVLAVSAAVSTAVAVVPLGGPPARGLRIERLRGAADGRPTLLRLALEDGGTRYWRAPSTVTLRARDARGRTHVETVRREGRGPWLLATLPALTPPITLDAEAESLRARAEITVDPAAPAFALRDSESARMDVAVEGYVLTPEVGGAAIFTAGTAHAGETIDARGDDPTLAVGPERVALDACGMAALYARPGGLAAPVVITLAGVPHRFRFALAPGAVTSRVEGNAMTLGHALGGITAYVVLGDRRGPLRWRAVPLDAATDRTATATVALDDQVEWAIASASSDFDRVSGAWRVTPPGLHPCEASPLGAHFLRIAAPTPPLPSIALVYDGAQRALDSRGALRGRNRRIAVWWAAASLSLLAALVLRSGRNPDEALDREGLSQGSGARKIVALGVVSLAAMALALALVVQLRT